MSDKPSSADAKEEILDECENIWKELEECQGELRARKEGPLTESNAKFSLLLMQMKALTAELTQWEKRSPEIPLKARSTVTYDSGEEGTVPTTISPLNGKWLLADFLKCLAPDHKFVILSNPEVLLRAGREQLQKVKTDLEMVLSLVQSRNKVLQEDLEREQQWKDEQENILKTLEETEKQMENEVLSSLHSQKRTFQELQDNMLKVKAYKQELLNALGEFLDEHFPLPEQHGREKREEMEKSGEPATQLMTMHEILETLVTTLLKTPHEPYITVDSSFWPPYVEILLRWGIVLRHPEDSKRIRLEAFHQ